MAKITIDMESIVIDDYGEDLQELIKREAIKAMKHEVAAQMQIMVREKLSKYQQVLREPLDEAVELLEKSWRA